MIHLVIIIYHLCIKINHDYMEYYDKYDLQKIKSKIKIIRLYNFFLLIF